MTPAKLKMLLCRPSIALKILDLIKFTFAKLQIR